MKHKYIYILLPLLVLLTSCDEENWFIHSVPYNDKVDKPELVVTSFLQAGKKPVIYVNESVFFLDPNHSVLDTVYYQDGYFNVFPMVRPGFLPDAEVEMIVNGGLPIRLIGAERLDTIWSLNSFGAHGGDNYLVRSAYAYTCDYILQPGDKVELNVTHPRYERMARVEQDVPRQMHFEVSDVELERLTEDVSVAKMKVHLLPYEGDPTDLLCFRTISKVSLRIKSSIYDYTTNSHRDTLYIQDFTGQMTFSQDLSFVGYDKVNTELSSGYFGAGPLGLFRAVPMQDESLTIYAYIENPYIEKTGIFVNSVTLDVQAVTREHYLYYASMCASGHLSNYVPDYFVSEGDGGNIIEDISDIFDEMGSMEGVQIYNNVENAIGHVTALASSCYTYVHLLSDKIIH